MEKGTYMIPMFSVIIPSHNGADTITMALKSVLCQTYDNYELIVVCDACTDNTEEIARQYGATVILSDAHREGPARNAGIVAAKGKWILFLDDDDYFIHEYCFDLIAKKLSKSDTDVLNFAFIWKGKGYQTPRTQENQMVWARAWRREFISQFRFDDAEYGTDKNFYHMAIENNVGVKMDYLDTPIIYYNYMRKGSMTSDLKEIKQLDIIVTHYDEPWSIGKPFFDMIENQRLVERSDFSVTLVQDGEDYALNWDKLFAGYSYDVHVVTVPHGGTASARNAGINATSGDWIMFCDFDDMFADVCSLHNLMSNFPVNDMDIIWGKMVEETKWNGSGLFMNCVTTSNFSNTHCKLYRRQFLAENHITFDPRFPLHYDYMFNAVATETTAPFRIAMAVSDFFLYYKTYRNGSQNNTHEAQKTKIDTTFDRDAALADIFRERGLDIAYKKTVMTAVCDEFYRVYHVEGDNLPPVTDERPDLIRFVRDHIGIISGMNEADIEVICDMVETEKMNLTQSMYNNFMIENYFVNEDMQLHDWLAKIIAPDDITTEPTPEEPHLTTTDTPRVVVYCGTYNTYMNMVASAKSLLWHTRVDKIYFLIEDDTFPYEIPDIIECINVKNQPWFPQDGPNYHNSWSYMCLMRAAFTKLIPYSKILSFDIDVVVQEDIGCLFDIDISDYYLAGVIEPQRQKSTNDPIYINFGVVLMNLDKLRQDGIDDQIISALNRDKFGCPEQDAFNKFCSGHILQLPNDYNSTVYSHITGEAEHDRIIHYAGIRFWRHFGHVREYALREWQTIMERQAKLHE